MAQGKRAARRARAAEKTEQPRLQVLTPQAFDGFIVEPGENRGVRLVVMRSRSAQDTRITFHTPDSPTHITLSDVAIKAVVKQLNALVKL